MVSLKLASFPSTAISPAESRKKNPLEVPREKGTMPGLLVRANPRFLPLVAGVLVTWPDRLASGRLSPTVSDTAAQKQQEAGEEFQIT